MKKFIILLLTTLSIAFYLTACKEKIKSSSQAVTSSNAISSSSTSESKDSQKSSEQETLQNFYGTYTIVSYINIEKKENYIKSRGKDYVGDKFTINKTSVTSAEGNSYNPEFEVRTLSSDTFMKDYAIPERRLNLNGKDVTVVTVKNFKSKTDTSDKIGSILAFSGGKYYTFIGNAMFELSKS